MLHCAGYQLMPFLIFFLVVRKVVTSGNQSTSTIFIYSTFITVYMFKAALAIAVAASPALTALSVSMNFADAAKKNVGSSSAELLPDLQTVIPQHLQIQNEHKRELLRFANGIANTGDGPWHMRPIFPLDDPSQPQSAYQDIFDASGNVVESKLVSQFEFHPAHNHWHIGGVAVFEVRSGSPDGPLVGDSIKSTACLIDWYKINDNSKTPERVYWDCMGESQGITVGWVDQYHHSLEGQEIDITGSLPGRYYLVSTANPENIFIEKDYTNNAAWVAFDLTRDSKGNAKIKIVDHSDCDPGLCGENSTNR